MKTIFGKIPAMIAMLISLFSFVFYVQYLCGAIADVWIISVLVAVLSLPFYFVDAIISLVKAIKKKDPKFNYILALLLVGAIPMVLIFGGDGKDHFNVIWNVYYLLLFVLEVISIKKAFAAAKAARMQGKESAAG